MAVETDVLRTVFQVLGAAELTAAYAQAAAAAGTLEKAQSAVTATAAEGAGALTAFLTPVAILTAQLSALAGALLLVKEGLSTFADESGALFRTGVILKNTASSLTLPEVRQFAQATSEATGIARPQITGTAGLLARTGVGGDQIRTLLTTIADTARATGKSFDEVGLAVERGILGKTRGLTQFGIVIEDTRSKAGNLALIQQQLNLRFEGAALAFRETLPGAIDAFQSSLQRFLSGLGEQFAPAAVRVLNGLVAVIDFLTDHVAGLADAIANLLGGPIAVLLLHLSQAQGARDDPLARVGHGGDPATEATAQQIADNTKLIADAVEQQVLGGTGEVVRQQFGFLQARIAMNI